MENLVRLLETLDRLDALETEQQRLKYTMDFYVQEKSPTIESYLEAHVGGSTVILPNARISTKKIIEAILEHLELKLDYTTGKHPDVVLRKLEAEDG